ncbi:(Na+)-NQR maturation NqrM [Ursidibacter maritimus]|uniref:(Na+)-NQR maturation NqrM n=1 Tax=Ursidibacter maritimus TaxID=1331689 RepID=A0A949T5A3_9PAST|nr:(Na+)-NQR maturation NqrM [Ursidibacter maritimus]KAE9538281.1 hypothetical protein A1D26_06740 [Ursidibacter maritimus]MBV6524802.1 (Na+)-NQR maturation NqrM [Ursidibacter maritimus]MBV6525576.1 (Na+)-NQR maturation NqrM [Ursidibacter maritimus]MBV6527662.1 (Na+)-NQR maturation NqrM [Ursidibacter maritimus]MBV6529749.1 (Na+)-NQR maturation NqrM [Ursidibacter maritimus]
METILLTFGFFVAIVFMMSIGFIIKGKTIKGSCGGITALGMKKMCDCEEPCDNLQAKLAAGDEDAKVEYEQKFAKKETQFYEVK